MAISLEVNCGYARVAIQELTSVQRGRNGRQFYRQKRQDRFQEIFDLPTFGLPTDYFDMNGHRPSRFIAVVNINLTFSQKSVKYQLREQNTLLHSQLMHGKTSLLKKWLNIHCQIAKHASTTTVKSKQPIHPSQYSSHSLRHSGSEKTNAKHILKEVNSQWENMYGHTFTDALPKLCPATHLKQKKSKKELKKKTRKQQRKISNHVTQQMCKNATITTLATGESLAQYHRK